MLLTGVIRAAYRRLERHESPAPKSAARLNAVALGDRVKARRQALGWSQMQAAEHFAMHQATWSRLERGQGRYTPTLLKRLTAWLTPAARPPTLTPEAGPPEAAAGPGRPPA